MNTLGKILVILNFLFAVIVAFLLAFDVGMRNKWKEAHDSIVQKDKILLDSRDNTGRSLEKILADYKDKLAEIETLKQKNADDEATRKAKEDEFDISIAKITGELKGKDLIVLETQTALKRKTQEIALLNENINSRESSIVKLETDNTNLRITAVQYESMFRAVKIQNETLLAQNMELAQTLAKKDAGLVSSDVQAIRNPNEPNPPSVLVNGKIERVDAELVQLTVGTDHGVQKNQTFDVYRLQPEAKYLGMVRIVDANPHQSVGRLIPSGNAQFRTPLRAGDLVTSKLTR
jgi:hypothetical protein